MTAHRLRPNRGSVAGGRCGSDALLRIVAALTAVAGIALTAVVGSGLVASIALSAVGIVVESLIVDEFLDTGAGEEGAGAGAVGRDLQLGLEDDMGTGDVRNRELVARWGTIRGDTDLEGSETRELHTVTRLEGAGDLAYEGLDDGEDISLVDGALLHD